MTSRGDPFAGIPGRRIFVAVPVSAEAREAIEAIVASVRGLADPGEREVRWVRLDGLHVTLRFIGPTLEPRIADALEAVRAAAAASVPFEAAIAGGGAFPVPDRPRALWLGIGQGAAELTALTHAVDRELAARGWAAEGRPFRPHLTLARSDGIGSGARTAERLVAASAGLDIRWPVDRLALFESVTGGGPARYMPIGEAPFRGPQPAS
ncbi:MAG: 2,3-cyclic 3-phosphodiesterase [Chloroflexota bacterium]|jgi:2'-5' RNA ligase|nr:2,3-cyclic 3-phosphodiesterase [Chloroflexota bacterium]